MPVLSWNDFFIVIGGFVVFVVLGEIIEIQNRRRCLMCDRQLSRRQRWFLTIKEHKVVVCKQHWVLGIKDPSTIEREGLL